MLLPKAEQFGTINFPDGSKVTKAHARSHFVALDDQGKFVLDVVGKVVFFDCAEDAAIYLVRHGLGGRMYPKGFPAVVTLCGSTRFGDAFREAMRTETLSGKIVLSVGLLGHQEGLDMDGPVKIALDELHKRKIDISDEIFVLNCKRWCCSICGEFAVGEGILLCNVQSSPCRPNAEDARTGVMRPYIGPSTRSEIDYAISLGKKVRYLEEPE